jgi:hypothetical protein
VARRIDSFDDTTRGRRYPWLEWTEDGSIWEITKGEDYDVPTENMRVNLHERAKFQHQTVRTQIVRGPSGEGLRFQFVGPPMIPTPDGKRRLSPLQIPTAAQTRDLHADDWDKLPPR